MTNKIFSMVDGKRIGFAPNLTPRLHRVDSVSIVSRQSLLPILLLCLTLFLGVGNAWGDESWDLTTNSYSSSSTSTVTWNGTNATMTLEKNGGTNANNYLGGSGTYTHTRVYNKNILRITPASGKTISSIEITATSNSYTIVGTWTNGSASSSGSKTTVTPTDGTKAVYCTCSDTKRLTGVVVKFGSSTSLEQVTISGNPTLKNYEAGDVFDPAGLTVTGTYSNSTNSDIEDGITWTAYNGSSYVALSDAPLTQGQTTLKVKATVGAVTSAEFTVTNLSVVAAYSKVTITQSQVTSFTNKYAEYSWSANSVSGKLNAYKNSGMQFNTGNNTTSTGYVYNTVAVPGKIVYITMTTASGTERSWTPYVSSSALTPSNYSTAGTALTSQTVKTTGTRWNVTGDNSYFYLLPPSSASVISSIVVAYESCTELGSINGSVYLTNEGCAAGELKATWKTSSTGLDGIASQTVKVYRADNNNEVTGLTGLTGKTAQTTNQTVTISGLTPCVEYYVKIWNVSKDGSYCESDFAGDKSSNVAAASYTITKTGVTNVTAESLSAIPATTCASGFNATIVAASGYDLPSTITVTGASHTWDQKTGALTISNVTGNVDITITPTEAQCDPLTAPSVSVSGKDYPYDAVTLSWTAVEHADGYTVEIYDGETKIEGDDLDGGADSYTITTTLAANKTYTYKVKATSETPATYCESNWATDDFTTSVYPTVKLFYSENGVLSEGVDQQILTDFTLPNEAAECSKTFIGWTTQSSYSHASEAPDPFYEKGATFQIPTNANCTLYAVYADVVEGSASYDKVTSAPDDWSGEYLIVYEDGSIAFNGGLETLDAASNTISVTISENAIEPNTTTDAAKFTIAAVDGGYSIKSASNKYIGQATDANGLTGSETAMTNTISVTDDGNANIVSSGGAYLRYNSDNNQARFRYYKSSSYTSQKPIQLYKKNVTEASVTNYVTICQGKVAKPVINGVTDGETYEEAKTITITSATNGATIYYTTDGTEPTTSSNAYSAPFEVSANGDYTIRAIAVKDEMVNSDEATAVSFTLDLPFTTIASFIEAAPSTAKKLVFTAESNARVLAYNKNRIYIQDGTGAMFLYNTGTNSEGHGKTWASGKKIVGTLTGTYTTNDNMPRMTVTDFGATDVTNDAIELPTPIAVEELATNFASNVCKLVTINGVSIRSESVDNNKTINMTKNNVTYNIYNAFNVLTSHKLPLGTTSCTVTGILGQSNSGTTLQLMPISADGISTNGAEAVLPVLSVTGSTNSAEPFEVATNKEVTFTPNSNFDAVYAINDGEEAAVTGSSNVTITDEANATKVTIRATREYYTTKEVSYYYRANSALIEYDITKGAMSHGSATIQNAQGDAITYAVGGATVTLVANPAEHYHWVSWNVTAGGEPVTVTNNTFEMPNATVTVSATFEEDDYATVAFAKGNESVTGTVPTSQKVYVGENATMPGKGSMILSSHNFAGWKLGSNAVLNTGDAYTVTAADHEAGTITFEAQWEPYPWASAGKWELVTSASEITVNPTTYVIFADTLSSGNTACGLTQNDNNRSTVSVTKTDNLLTWTGADPAIFIVEEGKDQGTFAFYDAINNNYIHAASSVNKQNYLRSNTDKNTDGAAWTIDAIRPNGGATVTADTYTHNLLNLNGNTCAAYTSPQKGLAIYKFVGGSYYNIVYAKGTEDVVRNMPESHVTNENAQSAIKDNTPIRVGYTFTGWKDQDENVYTYNDGHVYTFTKNVTLTAQWEEQTDKYTVSYDANGSSDAVPADVAYFENEEVTVAGAVSKEGNVFMGWECNGRVYTAGSKFYMPATDMPMVAKYAHGATYVVDTKTSVTTEGSVPEGSSATFVNTNNTPKQITSGKTMTLTLSGYTGYTIKGVQLNAGTNNSSGEGTLSITIGGDEVATGANADKWYDGNHHYGTNNGTDFESVLVSMNPKTVKYGEDIVITIVASVNSLYCQSFTILYDLLPVEVENTTTIEARDLAAGTAVTIHDGGTLNVNADKTLDNLTVEAGGKVSGSANLIVNDLTIKTSLGTISGDDNDGGKSGEISNNHITANGDVWIEIELTQEYEASYGWYAFSVPFKVDAMHGVYGKPDSEDWQELQNEVGYAIMSYHGDVRAQGKYGWKKYRDIMKPGTLYIIAVGKTEYKTLRFKKVADADIVNANQVQVYQYPLQEGGQTGDNGWNGVGNPNLQVSHQNDYPYLQFLDHDDNCFRPRTANKTDLLVGTAFMVQAAASGNITIATGANTGTGNIALAPAREPKAIENTIFEVKLRNTDTGKTEDNLFFTAREDATNEYEIGRDVTKMSMGNAKCAQMWVPAYGTQLCAADFPLINNKAEYPLSINTPKAGTYSISVQENENATIYLTRNGRAIWNLSMSACELDLAQGQNEGYGLKLVINAPAVVTGVDQIDAKADVQKVIIDEHVYILRGGQMYDVNGKLVK